MQISTEIFDILARTSGFYWLSFWAKYVYTFVFGVSSKLECFENANLLMLFNINQCVPAHSIMTENLNFPINFGKN